MGTLTPEQEAGLLFMANEEKLAHDVYAAFAEQYGVPYAAVDAYHKVEPPGEGEPEETSTYLLARRRLRGLEKPDS